MSNSESRPWPAPFTLIDQRRPGRSSTATDIAQHLAAIVACSDDAILTKDLDGTITSWNEAAERLFGYSASEIIGTSIMKLLPPDRRNEEITILARLRRGERIHHYETVRLCKDGCHVEISLSVSPLRGGDDEVIGASTIARDITEKKQAEERQHLLVREMHHRLKNLFALSSSLVSMSVRDADSAEELASVVQERLSALARAHALTLPDDPTTGGHVTFSLHTLLRTILAPYQGTGDREGRLDISGDDLTLPGHTITTFALILHELATNSAKYGALTSASGSVSVRCEAAGEKVILIWDEVGGPVSSEPEEEGFGSLLGRLASRQLGGSIEREWLPEGLRVTLAVSRDRIRNFKG